MRGIRHLGGGFNVSLQRGRPGLRGSPEWQAPGRRDIVKDVVRVLAGDNRAEPEITERDDCGAQAPQRLGS